MSDRDPEPALARMRGVAAVLILAVPLSGCVSSGVPAADPLPAVVVPTDTDISEAPGEAESPTDTLTPNDTVAQPVPPTPERVTTPVRPSTPKAVQAPVRTVTPNVVKAPVAVPEIVQVPTRPEAPDGAQAQTPPATPAVVQAPAATPDIVQAPIRPERPDVAQAPVRAQKLDDENVPSGTSAPLESVSPDAALAGSPTTDRVEESHRNEAADFIAVLAQLPGYLPFETTLAFERAALASDDFLVALRSEGKRRGYGVRDATSAGLANEVRHVGEVADDGQVTRTISFGEAQMRRRFAPTDEGGWRAASSLFIRGVDASRVRLESDTPAAVAQADTSVAVAPVPSPDGSDAQSLTDETATSPSADATTPARLADAALQPLERPRNVAELGQSNFAGVFEDYSNVEEIILVFSDDSMVLGDENKKIIQSTVADVDATNDLFSILGCSFGRSAIENGNEVLATGRATRVKEALVFAGVPADRILDEGCWAGAPKENFPGRGVVLTVKRARG